MIFYNSITAITALAFASLETTPMQAMEDNSLQFESKDNVEENFGDWLLRCSSRGDNPPCQISQSTIEDKTGKNVMQISISHAGNRDVYGLFIRLPLGVHIQGGVLIRIDDTTDITDYSITRCEQHGCIIERIFDLDDVNHFRSGNKGIVAVLDRTGNPIVIPISLDGFSNALKKMKNKNVEWSKRTQQEKDS